MSAGTLEIRTYRSLGELQAVEADWRTLLAQYPQATTFSTPEWLIPWWKNFGNDQQLLVAGFFAGSRLVALAPLSLTMVRVARAIPLRQLRLMGDGSKDSDNLDLAVLPGFEESFAASLLHFLEGERSHWDFAELNTLPPHSPGASALRQLLARKKWIAIEKTRPASAIKLPATWEEYLGQLSSEDQKNLVRYARRLEKRYAVQTYRCGAESQLAKCLEALFKHHQARWEAAGERGSFGSQERRNFYYELSRSLLAQDLLDLWVLELNGVAVAAQFGFRYGQQVFQLQEGNDPAYASDRVGFLLRGHVMKELIAQGVRTYDFLGGKPGYKARWGAESRNYLDLQFAQPFTIGAAYLTGMRRAKAGKEWLRRSLPESAWRGLHRANVKLRGSKKGPEENKIG
jgi:CelD/BcsL family acetyltransferase involved in cellulose biosynthesis